MPTGDKTKDTYEKVAQHWEKKGKISWAKAKNDEGGHHYKQARDSFDRAKRARESGEKRYGK